MFELFVLHTAVFMFWISSGFFRSMWKKKKGDRKKVWLVFYNSSLPINPYSDWLYGSDVTRNTTCQACLASSRYLDVSDLTSLNQFSLFLHDSVQFLLLWEQRHDCSLSWTLPITVLFPSMSQCSFYFSCDNKRHNYIHSDSVWQLSWHETEMWTKHKDNQLLKQRFLTPFLCK